MWKGNGKITTLLLFLDRLFPKTEAYMWGRRGRRRRKLLDDLKERKGYSHLKEEALDRTMWRARFGRSFGPVVRLTAD
jgi:hypothetical protein